MSTDVNPIRRPPALRTLAALAAAIAVALAPRAASALDRTVNHGFETGPEPGGSWTEGGTIGANITQVFQRTSAAGTFSEGAWGFDGHWTTSRANRSFDKTLSQTFTPATNVRVRLKGSYKRQFSGTVSAYGFHVVLRGPSGIVATAASTTVAASDSTWQGGTWTPDVILSAGVAYAIELRWSGTFDTTTGTAGAYVDDVQLQVAPTGLTATSVAGSTAVQLAWDASTTPSGPALRATDPYQVYRGASSGGEASLAPAATNAYSDASATGNTTYWYQVTDLDASNVESPRSSEASVLTRPGAPSALAAGAVTGSSVAMSWSAPAGGTQYYVVERADDVAGAPGAWSVLDDAVPATQLEYTDGTVAGASTYWYRVSGRNASGGGAPSSTISATTSAGVPTQPGTPVATPSATALEIVVSWEPASGVTDGYKVWRSTDGVSFGTAPVAAGVSSPWTDGAANGLEGNTQYFYRVQGTNLSGDGPLSAASAGALTIPGAPAAPVASAIDHQLVRVSWLAPSGPGTITGYRLYRSQNGGPFALLPGSPTSPYDDTSVSSSTTYAYKVAAVNATGEGFQSFASADVTTPEGPPAAPAAPAAVPSTAAIQVAVSWSAVSGATAYDVWRSTDGVSFGASPVATGATSPWTDTAANGLAANSTYFYAVQARNAYGSSALSASSAGALTIPDAPAAPTLSDVLSNSITVTWSPPAGGTGTITGYRLYRSASGGAFGALPGSPTSPFVDLGVQASTSYAYKVAALNATGEGFLSAASPTVTTLAPLPGTPGPITFTYVKSYSVRVNWTAATNVTSYKIERAPDEAGLPGTFVQVGQTSVTYFDSLSLSPSTRYWYRVRSANSTGDGPYNSPAAVTTLATPYLYVGDGTDDPTPVGVCPSPSPSPFVIDDFTLDAAVMADTVTKVTVTFSPSGAWANLGKVEVTSADGLVVYGTAQPGADATVVALARTIPVAIGSGLHYELRVTPKSALSMPAPRDGRSYDVRARVTGLESTNVKTYGDAGSRTFHVDNGSPPRPTWISLTPTADSIGLSWNAPVAPDRALVVRRAGGPVMDAPEEGTAPVSGALGSGTIVYEGAGGAASDGSLSAGTPYHYALFVRDSCNNWSPAAAAGPIYITTGAISEGDPTPDSMRPVVSIENPAKGASVSGPFRVQVRVSSRSTAITNVQLNYAGPTGWLGTWVDLVRNTAYYPETSTLLGVFEGASRISLAAGAYTLVARASNDGGATWVNSAAVAISVNASGKGDGNLLVRDNSNQLCTDCHAIKPHSSETSSAKHGSWSTSCRDCHAPHGSKNAYLVKNEIPTPGITGAPTPRPVFFADATKSYTAVTPSTTPSQHGQAGFATQDFSGICQTCHTRTTGCANPPCDPSILEPMFRNSGTINLEATHGEGTPCTACHTHTGGFKSPRQLCHNCHGVQSRASYPAAAPPVDTCGNTGPQPGSTTNRVGAHAAHLAGSVLTNGYGCEQCHVNPPTRAFHENDPPLCSSLDTERALFTWGSITQGGAWSGPVAPSYDYTFQTCSNYCHGNFRNGNDARPSWNETAPCGSCHGLPPGGTHVVNADCSAAECHGSGYTVTGPDSGTVNRALHANGVLEHYSTSCTSCHGAAGRTLLAGTIGAGDPNQPAAPPMDSAGALTGNYVGPHLGHVRPDPAQAQGQIHLPFRCSECHTTAVDTYTAAHPDPRPAEVSYVDAVYAKLGGVTASATPGSPVTCTTYCHGATFTAAQRGNVATWAWDGTLVACGSCHASPPADDAHASVAAGSPATACNRCHDTTVGADGKILFTGTGATAATEHIDGTYDTGGMSCQSCHGADGRTQLAGTIGVGDEKVAAAPPLDAAGASTGNYVGPHLGHVRPDPLQAEGQIHLPFRCSECHTLAVDSYTMGHPDPRPAEVSYVDAVYADLGGVLATATPGSPVTCTTYCHGATFDPATQRGSVTTWAWDGSSVTCGSCHQFPPTDPEHTSVTAGPPGTACNPCHTTTVATDGKIVFDVVLGTTEHIDGGYDTGGISCQSCHGGTFANAAPPEGLHGETATTTLAVGAHQSHVQNGGARNALACTQCHPDNTAMNHANGGVPETTFLTTLSTGTVWTRTATPPTCASSYCHGGQSSQAAWGGSARTPEWTVANGTFNACTACHAAPPPLNATTHHSPNPSCSKCHGPGYVQTAVSGDALDTHVDGAVTLTRTLCTLCHGDLTATGVPYTDPRSMPGYNASAADCTDQTVATAAGVGGHGPHLLGTRLRTTASTCADCHPLPTTDTDRAHATGAGTNGARATVSWSPFVVTGGLAANYTGSQTASGADVAGTCSNTYCHGGKFNGPTFGAAYQGSVMTPSWTGGAAHGACGACHKIWPTSTAHGSMTDTTNCGACHPGFDYTVANGGTVNLETHINGKMDGGGGPNCTSVDCHGGTSIATRRNVLSDYANGTGPQFRSHHVGNGNTTVSTVTPTGAALNGMGGTLTNNDCYVCHAEAIQTSPGVWSTGALHTNTTIDLRDSDTGMVYPYAKHTISGAAGEWNSSNPTWVTETSTHLDPFCNSCHDADGATNVSAFWEAGATAGNPFNDGAVTNNYDRWIRCPNPPCAAPGFVVDIASRVDDDARRADGTYWTAMDRDVAGEERGPDGRTDPPYGVYSRHAIRGMSVSVYGSLNQTGSAWDGPGTPTVGTSTTYWNRSKVAWASNSVMGCADCHTHDGANGAAGNAHGSTSEYLLKDASGGATEGTVKPNPTAGCFQCHTTGGYQAGSTHTANSNDYQEYVTLAGVDRISSTWPDATTTGGNVYGHSCLNCHGGGMPSKVEAATRPGGFGTIHGTNQILGIGLNGASGDRRAYRFTNGNSLRYYNPSNSGTWTGGGSCYTISATKGTDADQWGGCNKHDGSPYTFPAGNRPLKY